MDRCGEVLMSKTVDNLFSREIPLIMKEKEKRSNDCQSGQHFTSDKQGVPAPMNTRSSNKNINNKMLIIRHHTAFVLITIAFKGPPGLQ